MKLNSLFGVGNLRLRDKFGLVLFLLTLLCVAVTCVCLYFVMARVALDSLGHQLKDSATLIAAQLDPRELGRIHGPADAETPEYKRLQSFLDKTRKSTLDLANVYIFRLSPDGKPVFVVDESNSDGKESADIGELIADPDDLWAKILKDSDLRKRPHADDFVSHDRFGDWISGFAPVKDADGHVDFFVGVDMDAREIREIQWHIGVGAMLVFLCLLPFILGVAWFAGGRFAAPLVRLKDGLAKVQNMDFDIGTLKKAGNDEVADLGAAFDSMRRNLKDATDKLNQSKSEIEAKNAFLRQFIEALPYPIFCKDSAGRYLDCNKEYARFCSISERDGIIGRTVTDVIPVDLCKLHASMDEMILSGRKSVVSYDVTISERSSNTLRHFTIYKAAFKKPDGSIGGLVGALVDMTDRKRMEDELRRARLVADAANFAKSRFLANMSHEIRTPLNGIIGAVEVLKETISDEAQKDLLETMEESGRMLIGIIGDVLDLAKIESGKMLLEEMPCDLNEILSSVCQMFKPLAQRKGVLLKFVPLPEADAAWVYCDPTRLRQVLNNLVGNAVKFTSSGSVVLSVERTGSRQGYDGPYFYHFSVKDTGVGIDSGKIQAIFEDFGQEDVSTSRRHGGTGLGLSISKHLVILMGGSINAESVKGEGSVFHCMIPMKGAMDPSSLPDLEPGVSVDAKGLGVLIVDDHAPSVKVIRCIMEFFGCRCVEAHTCAGACDILGAQRFDVLVLDLSLADGSGYDIAKFVRQREAVSGGKRSFIVAVTANSLENDKEDCVGVGIDELLLKPVTKANVAKLLAKCIELRKGS